MGCTGAVSSLEVVGGGFSRPGLPPPLDCPAPTASGSARREESLDPKQAPLSSLSIRACDSLCPSLTRHRHHTLPLRTQFPHPYQGILAPCGSVIELCSGSSKREGASFQ